MKKKKPPQAAPMLVRLLTRQEAAELLVISIRTLDRLTKAGQIPCQRIGRSIRYRLRDLEHSL